MRILLVAATAAEIGPVTAGLRRDGDSGPRTTRYGGAGHDVDVLVTGVGMVATATWCAQALCRERYDLALNLGVCGSFDRSLTPGTVVHVVSDRLAELGAEDDETFLSIHEMHLLDENEPPFVNGALVNQAPPVSATLANLPAVSGITVNTVHGRDQSIAAVTRAIRTAGREHGRRGVHVRVPGPGPAIRAGPRGLERRRAPQSRGVENGRGRRQPWRARALRMLSEL